MRATDIWHLVHLLRGKVIALALALLLLPMVSHAQLNYIEYVNKKLYFGITLGMNTSKFKVINSEAFLTEDSINVIESTRGPGFNLGIITNLKMGKYFDLRFIPSLAFGEKNLNYTMWNDSTVNKTTESINLEFPVNIRFKSQPIKDIRLYVLTGLKYNLDLASNAKARKAEDQVRVTRGDLSYEFGFGVQFFFPLFIFSPEIKISNGFLNVHSNSDLLYSRTIDKLFSRTITFSLHFEG